MNFMSNYFLTDFVTSMIFLFSVLKLYAGCIWFWPDFALVLISRVWLQARIFHAWSETICLNTNIYRCILQIYIYIYIYIYNMQSVWQEVYNMCTSWRHRHANENVGLVLLWISPVNSWVFSFGVQVWWRWVASDLSQLAFAHLWSAVINPKLTNKHSAKKPCSFWILVFNPGEFEFARHQLSLFVSNKRICAKSLAFNLHNHLWFKGIHGGSYLK
jgi:hypothetical protein